MGEKGQRMEGERIGKRRGKEEKGEEKGDEREKRGRWEKGKRGEIRGKKGNGG